MISFGKELMGMEIDKFADRRLMALQAQKGKNGKESLKIRVYQLANF